MVRKLYYYIERRKKQFDLSWQRIGQCQNEPRSHDGEVARGIAVGKTLLLTEKTVPARIMSLNHHPKRICFRVLFFGFLLRKITGVLANLLSSSLRSLRSDQTTKLSLITNYADIFENGQGGKGGTNVIRHKIDTDDARPIP
ncbi:hypothetical protein NQ318_007724 [Aromia moschata]|uniref:Uncharacterized protein n=1 Tax=Aromia moschata TaxID=1265417 RepID=A0AAV8YZP4_9CUCU|nr:hypothetical protein NQ318_007724 [Aromia moschata]